MIAYQPKWAPAAPTHTPFPPELDGGRTSVAFYDIHVGAELLGMSSGDPTKVVKALVANAQAHTSLALQDPEKLNGLFQWFHRYLHHSYLSYVNTLNTK